MNSPQPLLQASRVSYSYAPDVPVFQDINLQIQKQEIVALLGGSGCGKSSLLRLLAGLAFPETGEVNFLGQPLQQPHPRSALIFQQASLLPWLRVRDNASFGLNFRHQPRHNKATLERRVDEALAAVGLKDREKAWPSELSGGQAQRVALARALARQPELLFADEPFSALDAITRNDMQQLLVDLVHRWHTAVLLVTHDLDEALLVADRILLMGGSPGKLLREWQINLPHPRNPTDPQLSELRAAMLNSLHAHRQSDPVTSEEIPDESCA